MYKKEACILSINLSSNVCSFLLTLWSHIVHLNNDAHKCKTEQFCCAICHFQVPLLPSLLKIPFSLTHDCDIPTDKCTHTQHKVKHEAENFLGERISWVRKMMGELFYLLRQRHKRATKKNLCEMSTLAINAFATWRLLYSRWKLKEEKESDEKINIHNFCGLYCVTLL
jgi:hypothetical protein